jgi:hypothetical protein
VPSQAVHFAEITFGFDLLARACDLTSRAVGAYPIIHPDWLPACCVMAFLGLAI